MSVVVAQPKTYQKAYAFRVTIDGVKCKGFSMVDGLTWDDRRDRNGNSVVHSLRLRRGKMVRDTDLLDWFNERPMTRRGVAFELLSRDGFVQQRIGLEVHEFKTYDLSPLDNNADENVQESVTFSYCRIKELPLTQKDRDAVFNRVKGQIERGINVVVQKRDDAMKALDTAIESRDSVHAYWDKAVEDARNAYSTAIQACGEAEVRAVDEIVAAREEYGVANV